MSKKPFVKGKSDAQGARFRGKLLNVKRREEFRRGTGNTEEGKKMAEAKIAQTLNQAGGKVNYDAAEKSLAAQKSVPAYILLCGENHPKIAACKVLRSFRRGKFRSGKRKVAGYPV